MHSQSFNLHSVHVHLFTCIMHSTDINECELETHTCSPNANCTDTDGSFNCTCREGFEGDGFNCTGTKHILHNPIMHQLTRENEAYNGTCCTHYLFSDSLYLLLCRHSGVSKRFG